MKCVNEQCGYEGEFEEGVCPECGTVGPWDPNDPIQTMTLEKFKELGEALRSQPMATRTLEDWQWELIQHMLDEAAADAETTGELPGVFYGSI